MKGINLYKFLLNYGKRGALSKIAGSDQGPGGERTATSLSISVLIADRDMEVLAICQRILQPEKGIHIVGEARNGSEVIASAIELKPHVLFLDLNSICQGKDEASLLLLIREKSPKTKMILFSNAALSEDSAIKALSLGVRGYLDKDILDTHLARAIKAVAEGEVWIPRRMVTRILDLLISLTAQEQLLV
jgi:DNA-binding NarL/FixJ family response regulator